MSCFRLVKHRALVWNLRAWSLHFGTRQYGHGPHMIAVGDMTNQNSFKRILVSLIYSPPPTQFLIHIF